MFAAAGTNIDSKSKFNKKVNRTCRRVRCRCGFDIQRTNESETKRICKTSPYLLQQRLNRTDKLQQQNPNYKTQVSPFARSAALASLLLPFGGSTNAVFAVRVDDVDVDRALRPAAAFASASGPQRPNRSVRRSNTVVHSATYESRETLP